MDGNYVDNHWIAIYFTISKISADIQLITTYTNDTQQVILAARSNLPFTFDSDHILRISVDSHTQYNVMLDDEELFDYTYTADSCDR